VQATEGWLEPLLERIWFNPKAVPCPVIEEVNDKTLQYKGKDLLIRVEHCWGVSVRIRPDPAFFAGSESTLFNAIFYFFI
jgi:hypothetical protein